MKRLADKPFVLLGVNSDQDRDELKKIVVDEDLSWRSWCDGSTSGPIHTQWNIIARPSTYVIDAQGIIRHKNIFGKELDRAVDALLAEME